MQHIIPTSNNSNPQSSHARRLKVEPRAKATPPSIRRVVPRANRNEHSLAPLTRPLSGIIALTSIALAACSAAPEPGAPAFGQVELLLQTNVDGKTYELRGASFEIDGEVALTLESDESKADEQIQTNLPVGNYTVELQPGWALYQIDGGAAQLLEAKLSSVNPAAFAIVAEQTTEVAYRFAVNGLPVEFGDGKLAVSIDVDVQAPVSVFFSELMKNPVALPDGEGEYIELSNAGTEAFSLQGCTVARDTQSFVIEAALQVEAGGSVVFANGASPGFTPDYVYSSISLPNTGDFRMSLTCGGQELDAVSVVGSAFPTAAGKSASLSATAWSSAANDLAPAWCDATETFGTDFGTPGAANPVCPTL